LLHSSAQPSLITLQAFRHSKIIAEKLASLTSCSVLFLDRRKGHKASSMDIGNILNAKGNAAAAAEARRQQQLAQATPMSNRSSSDMDSEQGSNSSQIQPQPLHPSNNHPNRYPSPTAAAQRMQMMPSAFQTDGLQENAYPQNDHVNAGRSASDQTKKSFACSHCSKLFARRSDLARHGTCRPCHALIFETDTSQSGFIVASDPIFAIGLVVANSSFNAQP
jgi:hypothetical protein